MIRILNWQLSEVIRRLAVIGAAGHVARQPGTAAR